MKLKLTFILVYLFLVSTVLFFSQHYKEKEVHRALQVSINNLDTNFKIITHNFESLSQTIFQSILTRSDIIHILSQAKNASDETKSKLRENLYNSLKLDIKSFENMGLNLVLITEPNNKVFLRMHKPSIFGDDISNHRKAVAHANKTHAKTTGFEQGKISHAFRNIFPIYDKENDFVGTIDISFSSDKMQKLMNEVHNIHTHFLVNKRVIDSRVWKLKDITTSYKSSVISNQFMMSNHPHNHPDQEIYKKIIKANVKTMQESISKSKKFAVYRQNKAISFIPIFSILSDGNADAYLVSFTQSETLKEIFSDYTIINFASIAFITTVLILIYYFVLKNKDLERQKEKLSIMNEKLQSNEKRLNDAQHISHTGSWEWNLKTNKAIWSDELYNIYGYDKTKDPNPQVLIDQCHPDDKEKHLLNIENSLKTGVYKDEYKIIREPNKEVLFLYAIGQVVFDEDKQPLVHHGTVIDITERKSVEIELHEKEEMILLQSRQAAMGEMISMIAHQWRQPLTAISMCVNNLIIDAELNELSNEKIKKLSYEINAQTQHLSKTIDDFKNFFKPDKERQTINIEDIFNEALQIISKSLEYNGIKLITEIGENIPIANTYSREILQVIINLLKNAKEAFEDKTIEDKKITVKIFYDENSIFLEVCDNAGGVDPNIIEKIFDPYFTTKNEQNGTGLGLYMSKMIMEKHILGLLDVTNKDDGACFKLSIPVV